MIDCGNFHGALILILILNIAYVCACSMVCILCIYYAIKSRSIEWKVQKMSAHCKDDQKYTSLKSFPFDASWLTLRWLDYWAGLFVIWATSYKFSRLLNRGNDTFSFWVILTTNLSTITCLRKKTLKVNINVDRFWGWSQVDINCMGPTLQTFKSRVKLMEM